MMALIYNRPQAYERPGVPVRAPANPV